MKYTKIPNNILDSMADLKPAAFNLSMALCRLTYGYHRDEVKASLSDLQEITGLSRPAIVSASKEVEHLFASEKREKRITTYLVNTVYQIGETSKQSLPDELTEFTSSGKDSLPDTSSLKKERKLKEIIIWATFFEGMTGFIPPHE